MVRGILYKLPARRANLQPGSGILFGTCLEKNCREHPGVLIG